MLRAFNLGFIKIIGEAVKETKTYIHLSNVLEIQLDPPIGKIVVQPIDYPLNTNEIVNMKIPEYFLEYPPDVVKKVEKHYIKVLGVIQTGLDSSQLKDYMIN